MIKLFRKNHFLRNKVHNTSCILNHASPRHLKQYSRKRTNDSLSLFASELDRKPSMAKRRESRHVQSLRGIDLWLWYSLPFDSLRIRLRRRKWKSKQKSGAQRNRVQMHSLETKIPGNHIPTRISSARENRNRRGEVAR